jgi:UDP-N-acetylglucosamine transferase subunit ALG13
MNDEQTIAVARARAYQRRVIDHRMHITPKTVNMATLAATCSCNTDCDNHLTTKLSDRVIQAYLDPNPDEFADKPLKMSDITLGAILADMRAMVELINHKYATVFAQNGNSLPKPMIGIPAHKFKLKPDLRLATTLQHRSGQAHLTMA